MRLHKRAPLALTAALAVTGTFIGSGLLAGPAEAASQIQDAAPVDMPTGNVWVDGHTYTPVVLQDFNQPAALGSFASVYGTADEGYANVRDTSGRGVYSPDNVFSVSGGNLNYNIHSVGGTPLVGAFMPNGYTPQTYGLYSVRMQADNLPGYKVAFNLWPSSNVWNDGEVDWPDGGTQGKVFPASAVIGSYSNWNGMIFDKPSSNDAVTMGSGWHDYTIEWTPGLVRWYFDSTLVGQTTYSAGVPNKPMRWTLQAETQNDGEYVSPSTAGVIRVAWAAQFKY